MRKYTLQEVGETILRRSIPEPNSGCLLWEGLIVIERRKKAAQSYGSIRLRGKMVGVHRVAYEVANGPIPAGAHVLHKCDVALCCNPDHLFLGSNETNIADKVAKDRAGKKITLKIARETHALRKTGESLTSLASKFNLHPGYVSNLLSGKRRPTAVLSATQE